MKTVSITTVGLCIVAGFGLSACAGGMNGGTHTGNGNQGNIVTQYPIETAMLNIYTKPRQQNLVATVDNQSASAAIDVTPKGNMRFNNKSVQGSEISTINKINNKITNHSVATNYFTVNPLVFHGFTDSSGQYSLSTQTNPIPKMASVGSSSPLITETVYADSSKRQKIGTYRQNWSLTRETHNSAWFCIDTSANLLLSTDPNGTSSECYHINARGDILASKITLNQPTANGIKTLTFVSR